MFVCCSVGPHLRRISWNTRSRRARWDPPVAPSGTRPRTARRRRRPGLSPSDRRLIVRIVILWGITSLVISPSRPSILSSSFGVTHPSLVPFDWDQLAQGTMPPPCARPQREARARARDIGLGQALAPPSLLAASLARSLTHSLPRYTPATNDAGDHAPRFDIKQPVQP